MKNDIFIQFKVNKLELIRLDKNVIPSMNKNHVFAEFTFTRDWDNLNPVALYIRGDRDVSAISVPLINDVARIPNEFMEKPGAIRVLVFAGDFKVTNQSGDIVITDSGYMDADSAYSSAIVGKAVVGLAVAGKGG